MEDLKLTKIEIEIIKNIRGKFNNEGEEFLELINDIFVLELRVNQARIFLYNYMEELEENNFQAMNS